MKEQECGFRNKGIFQYSSAKKYIKFKTNEEDDDLKKNYWAKVETYLQSEKKANSSEDSSEDSSVSISLLKSNLFFSHSIHAYLLRSSPVNRG